MNSLSYQSLDKVQKSLPLWQQTYDLLCQAQEKLQFPEDTEFATEEINARGEVGLSLLQEAYAPITQ